MANKVKCPVCEKLNDKEDAVKQGRRYYCPNCVGKEVKDPRASLIGYIIKLTGKGNVKDFKLADLYHKEYDMSYEGIKYTLYYMYEVLELKVNPDTLLGLVPYKYKEARDYYTQKSMAIKHNKENSDTPPITILGVKLVKQIDPDEYRKGKEIDMTKL